MPSFGLDQYIFGAEVRVIPGAWIKGNWTSMFHLASKRLLHSPPRKRKRKTQHIKKEFQTYAYPNWVFFKSAKKFRKNSTKWWRKELVCLKNTKPSCGFKHTNTLRQKLVHIKDKNTQTRDKRCSHVSYIKDTKQPLHKHRAQKRQLFRSTFILQGHSFEHNIVHILDGEDYMFE